MNYECRGEVSLIDWRRRGWFGVGLTRHRLGGNGKLAIINSEVYVDWDFWTYWRMYVVNLLLTWTEM